MDSWFLVKLRGRGQSARSLARHMGLDPSAVSRMLRGQRAMKAEEQEAIAAFLGVPVAEVAAHRPRGNGDPAAAPTAEGMSEMPQSPFGAPSATADKTSHERPHHPAWGAMKGTFKLLPDVDLTEPADPEWGKVYDPDYPLKLHE